MNLFDLNSDKIIYNIDGKDIEMKYPICFGKEYDRWLVSKCGKVWSLHFNKLIKGNKNGLVRNGKKYLQCIDYQLAVEEDWWGDGSATTRHHKHKHCQRHISAHKMVMDTWKPLYDNPPEGVVWEEWEIVRDLPSVYNHIYKTVVIDHIDDDPTNNHLDNLRRVNSWDNQVTRKAKGI
tara:strand:- start:51 stop:584 length:534 start_codon:yes stop_codon:yes gene_type:complete